MKLSNQYDSINLFKFIMSLCVVAIHVNPMVAINNEIVLRVYGLIVNSAVPFFFLASGYLFYNISGINDLNKLKHRICKLIKSYVFWSVIYLPLAVYDYIVSGYSIIKSIFLYINGFFLIGEHYNSWMLWFLLSMIYGYIYIYIYIL